jgi:hypothetical protein
MVIFDQLRISDDGKKMYINLHVNRASYFENIYLDKITIMTANQVSEIAPELVADDYIYQLTIDGEQKELDLVITPNECTESFSKSDFSSDLFFVYVKVKGTPCENVPCRLDEMTTLGVTFDETLLYQKVMQFTRELNKECEIPKAFIDLILLWNGFKAAIETEHYVVAIDFWKKLFSENGHTYTTKGCGCNGRNRI